MSDKRKFRVVGGGRAEAEADISVKIKKHRWNELLRVSTLAVIAIIIVVLTIVHHKNQVYVGTNIIKSYDHRLVENTSYVEHENCLVSYSKDGISSMDMNGKVIWNITYEMQTPIVRTSPDFVAVGDYNGHIIYLIDEEGKILEIDTKLPLRNFSLSAEGIVAAIIEDGHNSWINLYNSNGEKIVEAKSTMSRTGYPVAVSVSGEVMAVSYFYVDGESMRSSVTFYNFGGVGENVTDHIVSSYDYKDAIVPTIELLDADKFVAVADNRLMFFEGDKKPVSTAEVLLQDEIQGVYSGDNYIGLVFFDQSGEYKYRLDVYSSIGKKQFSYGFDMMFKDIVIANNQILIYNDSHCTLLDSRGKQKFDGSFAEKVYFVSETDSARKYILVTGHKIDIMEFK